MKRYTMWLWIAVVFMFLTGVIHAISLFFRPEPQTEIDRQLIQLMTTYRHDLGAGFHPTTSNLFTALSSCFSLLCFLGGLTNAYLLKKKAGPAIMKGIVLIDLLVFAACFVMMAIFTFLPPIVLTGLIALFLFLAFISIHRADEVSETRLRGPRPGSPAGVGPLGRATDQTIHITRFLPQGAPPA